MTLIDTIQAALERASNSDGNLYALRNGDEPGMAAQEIAAAVVAWMQEPAQVERMAAAYHAESSGEDTWDELKTFIKIADKAAIRAAIAALAPDAGGGR